MKTVLFPIEKITPYDRNPRNAEAAVDAVAESIKEFGWRQPIVLDADNVIISGHARYFAAIKLGLEQVPVHIAKELTPDQARAYRLVDNKTADLAGWDDDLLAKEIMALSESDIDLASVGFDQAFLDGLGEQVTAELSKNQETGTKQLQLKFGKYSVPLDEEEFGKLVAALGQHEERTGTRFGFVTWLFDRSAEPEPANVSS